MTALRPPASADELMQLSVAQWQAVLAGEPVEAAAWMAAAAKLGHADALAVHGQWLLDGRGMPRDAVQALQSFLHAAQLGHAMAMNMAGRCHEQGWGTEVDASKAAHWYRKAAALELPEARYNLANLLVSGHGVKRDDAQALGLYQQAAAQGYAKAFGKLGRYHEDGHLMPQDRAEARRCYQRAAEGGDFRGQFSFAGMLAAEGRREDALHWLAKVPATATPRYLREAGALLLESPDADFQAIGQAMLERAGAA